MSFTMNWADKSGVFIALAILGIGVVVSAMALLAAGPAPWGDLALYLLSRTAGLEIVIALPIWLGLRAIRMLSLLARHRGA